MKAVGQKTFLAVVGVIFSLIGVLHILRAVLGWEAAIAGWNVPMWLSWLAIVVSAVLAYNAFTLRK